MRQSFLCTAIGDINFYVSDSNLKISSNTFSAKRYLYLKILVLITGRVKEWNKRL